MIIKTDGAYETHQRFPNSDWYNQGNFILDETTPQGQQMAQTYIRYYPFVDFTAEGDKVIEVAPIPQPEKPTPSEGQEVKLARNEQGIWEYVLFDIPLTKEQELEKKLGEQQKIIDALLGVSE
jgi:hypothetical protein